MTANKKSLRSKIAQPLRLLFYSGPLFGNVDRMNEWSLGNHMSCKLIRRQCNLGPADLGGSGGQGAFSSPTLILAKLQSKPVPSKDLLNITDNIVPQIFRYSTSSVTLTYLVKSDSKADIKDFDRSCKINFFLKTRFLWRSVKLNATCEAY